MAWKKGEPQTAVSFDELLKQKAKLDEEILKRQAEEAEGLKEKVYALTSALRVSVAEFFGIKVGGGADKKERNAKESTTATTRVDKNGMGSAKGHPGSQKN